MGRVHYPNGGDGSLTLATEPADRLPIARRTPFKSRTFSHGFFTQPSHPASLAFAASSSIALAVRATTGISCVAGCGLNCRVAVSPSVPGNPRPMSTRAGRLAIAEANASDALPTAQTSYPLA